MQLKGWIKRGTPWPLVLVLALAWVAMSWSDYRSFSVEEMGVDREVVLQYYDRELRLLEAEDRANAYQKWMFHGDDPEEWLRDSERIIRETYLDATGEEGRRLLDAIRYKLSGEIDTELYSGDSGYLSDLKAWLLDNKDTARSWDYEMYLANREDSQITEIYRSQNDGLMLRATYISLLYDSLVCIGLGFAIFHFIRRKKDTPALPAIVKSWAPSTVISVFFAANLLLVPWFYVAGFIYDLQELFFGWWFSYPVYELLWRGFPAFCLIFLFLKWPRNAWKTFGLGKPVHIPLLLISFSLVSLVEYLYGFLTPDTIADPTDILDYATADTYYMLTTVFSSVILAPLFEEIVFRGFLFQGLREKIGTLQAGVVSTVLFSLVHTQYDIWGLVYVGITGAVAAFLVWRTGSLKTAIALHALGNLLITWDVYLSYQAPL
ncbi:MAG: CPBP family intramembrane glutamic endopeptidase [Luteolibacter sp.]